MFKCPDQVIHAIFTAPSPAACGVTLDLNKEYLFTGKLETGRMYVTLCGYNPPWEDLSAAQKKSLTHRYQSGCDCKVWCVMGISHITHHRCMPVDGLGDKQWPKPCLYQE
uniref:Metalloproteinase inhibitor 2 n=1 Tax=Oncorhynchus tshawytscha TaxID=74940 RepID=A0A8C8FH61_ONCTS